MKKCSSEMHQFELADPVCPIEFVNAAFLYVLNIFIPLPQVHTALGRLHTE